jgi:hypothetical protein
LSLLASPRLLSSPGNNPFIISVRYSYTYNRNRIGDAFKRLVVKSKEIAVNDFKENLSRFLLNVEGILSTSKDRYGNFIMDSIEINAEVSAEGKVGFMGTEVGISGTHGIKFVFKRSATI